jgi:leader peptidase (prepilin peptidase)/N-methyltransferase
MTPNWMIPLIGTLFACAAFLGIQASAALCAKIEPFEDGPKPGHPPTPWLIGGAALIGAALAAQSATLPQLGLAAMVTTALVACWYSDVRVGIVPDYFTLLPLGVLGVVAFVVHDPIALLSTLAVTVPFALAALFSRGRGMGWGDVKLVALGGAALGLHTAIVAFTAASLIAVSVAYLRKRPREPLPFAPYLAGAVAVALAFNPL